MYCQSCNLESSEMLYHCERCGVIWVQDNPGLIFRNATEFFEYLNILLHELERAESDARRVANILAAHKASRAMMIIVKWADGLKYTKSQLVAVRPTQNLMVMEPDGRAELAEIHELVLEALHCEDVQELRIRLQRGGPAEVIETAEILQDRV